MMNNHLCSTLIKCNMCGSNIQKSLSISTWEILCYYFIKLKKPPVLKPILSVNVEVSLTIKMKFFFFYLSLQNGFQLYFSFTLNLTLSGFTGF